MNTTIKAIALAAVIALVAVTLVSEDSSAVEFTAGGFEYESTGSSGNNVTVVGWEGDSSEITIPVTVKNGNTTYNVASISADAFKDKTNLTKVNLSGATHLTSIGVNAFSGSGLTTISLPSSLITISANAFSGTKLASVDLPDSVETIGANAFEGTSITTIDMGSKVKTLGASAFSGCTSLTEATISPSVQNLGDSIFAGCTSLKTVTWAPTSNTHTIGEGVFSGCSSLTSFTIPDKTTSIGKSAFFGCAALGVITIPDTVRTIGAEAFSASGLKSVSLPESVTSLGDSAFSDCRSLTEVILPSKLDKIPADAFSGCSSLFKVNFAEEGLESIGDRAFQSTGLTTVAFPEGVTELGDSVLADCRSLISVTLPSTLRTVGDRAMESCPSLTAIAVAEGSTTFTSVEGVLFGSGGTVLLKYPAASAATTYEVPEGVTTISAAAFDHSINLTMVDIPGTVTSIGAEAFVGCSGITEILIASEELTVADRAFDLSDGGEPVSVEIFTDLEPFAEGVFGEGVTATYDEYKNYGIRSTDELLGDALIWVVIAIVLGVIFLAVSIRKVKS